VVKRHKAKGYWRDPENKRKFFLEIAAEKGLDPYDPKTWQNITYANLRERNVHHPPSLPTKGALTRRHTQH